MYTVRIYSDKKVNMQYSTNFLKIYIMCIWKHKNHLKNRITIGKCESECWC